MLGILINTFNDAKLLRKALHALFRNYKDTYYLWIDDDGSDVENYKLLQTLASQYNARLTRSPFKKGAVGPYMIVREVELFTELISLGAIRLLKMDPDTLIYSDDAFNGPAEADIYGYEKILRGGLQSDPNLKNIYTSMQYSLPTMPSYCQGGFYLFSPELVNKIIRSDAWKKYLELYKNLDFNCIIAEDRMFSSLACVVGGIYYPWDKGFFHGYLKNPVEYNAKLLEVTHPKLRLKWLWKISVFLRPLFRIIRLAQ